MNIHTGTNHTNFFRGGMIDEAAAARMMREQAYRDQSRMKLRADYEAALRMFKLGKRAVERTASEIATALKWDQGTVVQVLRRLGDFGMVRAQHLKQHNLSIYSLTLRGACHIGAEIIKKRKPRRALPKKNEREVTIRGVTYANGSEAARAHGVTQGVISRRKANGTLDLIGLPSELRSMPVTIRGVNYRSHQAAADALGISREAVSEAVRRGRVDFVGLGRSQGTPVTIRGVTYRSISAAARSIGCSQSSIKRAIQRGDIDSAGLRNVAGFIQ